MALRMPALEFFGLPGVGKSTVAAHLSSAESTASTEPRFTAAVLRRSKLSLLRRPDLAILATATALRIYRGIDAPEGSRRRRYAKVVRALVHVMAASNRDVVYVLDEGPFNWIMSLRWRDEHGLERATKTLVTFYRRTNANLVILEASAERTRERRIRRRNLSSTRAPKHVDVTVSWGARARQFERMVARLSADNDYILRFSNDDDGDPERIATAIRCHIIKTWDGDVR